MKEEDTVEEGSGRKEKQVKKRRTGEEEGTGGRRGGGGQVGRGGTGEGEEVTKIITVPVDTSTRCHSFPPLSPSPHPST